MESHRPLYPRASEDPAPGILHRSTSPVIIVDTNILMAIPQIDRFDWGVKAVHIYVLYSVMDELCGLARDRLDLGKARDAQVAYEYLDALLKRTGPKGVLIRGDGSRLFFVAPPAEALDPLDTANVDHQQIALAQSILDADPQRFCAVVTRDRAMAELANLASTDVQVIVPGNFALEESLRLQFTRRYDYWVEWQPEPETLVEHPRQGLQSLKPARPLQRRPDPESRLQRTVRSFYSQIKSARHRAILSIVPLHARLALTAHLIQLNARFKRRIVLLYVENAAAAEYWAAELRVRARLPVDAVWVVGDDGAAGSSPRVVVCSHGQVENHFRDCAAGLREGGRQITLVVDGADLLPPESLALLLLEDVQFIGFTRYKLIPNGKVEGGGLDEFFDQQSLLRYTFADAERDGWLRSFDLIRHPVIWQPEEAREYGQLNARYVRAHNAILKAFPALAQREDFWTALRELQAAVSDPRLEQYLVLKARREEMAQIAHGKLDALMSLLVSGEKDGRSLVYDPSGLWAPVLHNLLERRGVRVATGRESTTREEWDLLWHRFEAGRLDVLLMTDVPPFGLIRANPGRLVLTTPIAPFAQLVGMVDWALSHTHPHGRSPVEIHLLYLPGTPEEPALLALADAVRGGEPAI